MLKRAIAYAIERKQIMERLRYSESLYRDVIEDQTEFICRFFPDGSISLANQAFCRYLNATSTEILDRNFFSLIAKENLPLVTPSIESLDREIPNTLVEFRGCKFPEWCWQQWNIRAIFHDRKIVEYQAVGQDISDRKRAETENARLIASLHESQEFEVCLLELLILDSKNDRIFVDKSEFDEVKKRSGIRDRLQIHVDSI